MTVQIAMLGVNGYMDSDKHGHIGAHDSLNERHQDR